MAIDITRASHEKVFLLLPLVMYMFLVGQYSWQPYHFGNCHDSLGFFMISKSFSFLYKCFDKFPSHIMGKISSEMQSFFRNQHDCYRADWQDGLYIQTEKTKDYGTTTNGCFWRMTIWAISYIFTNSLSWHIRPVANVCHATWRYIEQSNGSQLCCHLP